MAVGLPPVPSACQLKLLASQCLCSTHGCWRGHAVCVPTEWCNSTVDSTAPDDAELHMSRAPFSDTSIVTFLVRRDSGTGAGKCKGMICMGMQFVLLIRLLRTVRLVCTTVPVHVVRGDLPSAWEAQLAQLGVKTLDMPCTVPLPSWAAGFHTPTFQKIAALCLTQFGPTGWSSALHLGSPRTPPHPHPEASGGFASASGRRPGLISRQQHPRGSKSTCSGVPAPIRLLRDRRFGFKSPFRALATHQAADS